MLEVTIFTTDDDFSAEGDEAEAVIRQLNANSLAPIMYKNRHYEVTLFRAHIVGFSVIDSDKVEF